MQDRPFRSAAAFYACRPSYPEKLLEIVARHCRLDGTGRLLDLGCGPGLLAIPLSRWFAEAIGMDPEPAMLEAASVRAGKAGVPLTLVHGGSDDLGPHLAPLRMVAIGRAFSWMDRDETLRRLADIVEPRGSVAIFEDAHPDAAQNRWVRAWHAVRRKWAPSTRNRARGGLWRERHPVALARSAFSNVRTFQVRYERSTSIDELVGRAYSMSESSPEVLGSNGAAFENDLRAALKEFAPDGRLQEVLGAMAFVARRPG